MHRWQRRNELRHRCRSCKKKRASALFFAEYFFEFLSKKACAEGKNVIFYFVAEKSIGIIIKKATYISK